MEAAANPANEEYKGRTRSRARTSVVAPTFAMSKSMSSEMALRDDVEASYQRALNFLTVNEPERRLDICLSYKYFLSLEEQAHALYGDAKYPRVEYSATDSRVTIYTAPTALHSSSAVALQQAISFSLHDILVQHGKQELFERIVPVGESTYESVDDQGSGSTKTPDGGLQYYWNGRTILTVVIEAGFSEGYSQLRDDIMVWLNEMHSRCAILLWLNERPRFRFPKITRNRVYAVTQLPLFTSAIEQMARDTPLGPYRYNQHNWFGTIDSAYIVVYRQDMPTNSHPYNSCPVVENGTLVVHGATLDIGLTIGDLFPPDEEQIADIQSEPVHVKAQYLLNALSSGAQNTAKARFNRFLRRSSSDQG
ncbi:hypothetical protein V1504DRAFT_322751 [Lipomyces starkeyi]